MSLFAIAALTLVARGAGSCAVIDGGRVFCWEGSRVPRELVLCGGARE